MRILLPLLLLVCSLSAPCMAVAGDSEWLVTPVFAGPGGLSLYGIDGEARLRPSAGDPFCLSRFDLVRMAAWSPRGAEAEGRMLIEAGLPDLIWPKGSAYAHLYVHFDRPGTMRLWFEHDGIDSRAWWDGDPIALTPGAPVQGKESASAISVTDQGNRFAVKMLPRQGARQGALAGGAGWHRLLLKLVTQCPEGGSLSFRAGCEPQGGADAPALRFASDDPEVDVDLRRRVQGLNPLLTTAAPFNLPHPQDAAAITLDLRPRDPSMPSATFPAVAEFAITDYDGRLLASLAAPGVFPGAVRVDLPAGVARTTGYYAVHPALRTTDGRRIASLPPDGFSVIAGAAAQEARKQGKKMAMTYYFLAGKDYRQHVFPYMRRMGILRNVGGNNTRNPDLYRYAYEQGVQLSADLWNHTRPDYIEGYVAETAGLVDSYKALNEIDLHVRGRATPEAWVEKSRSDWAAIRRLHPGALVLGASLVRPGSDPWFAECLKLGLDHWVDAWDVHAYPQQPPVLGGTLANSVNEAEQGMQRAYRALGRTNDKPFWMGETGARASHGMDARRWQADTVAKMAVWAQSRSDFRVIGFLIPWFYSRAQRIQGANGGPGGLNDIEAAHMPAEAALYTASALIDGQTYSRVDLGPGIQAARCGDTLMLWSTKGRMQVSVPLPGEGPWVRVDVVGRVCAWAGAALEIDDSPVYLLAESSYRRLTAFASRDE